MNPSQTFKELNSKPGFKNQEFVIGNFVLRPTGKRTSKTGDIIQVNEKGGGWTGSNAEYILKRLSPQQVKQLQEQMSRIKANADRASKKMDKAA